MALLNSLLVRLFDLLLFPFRQLPPIVGLAAVSLLTAVAMLLIFRATSDQRRLAAVKRQIHAALFEIRLFNDDLRAIFRAQGEMLRHNVTYLRLSLVPLVWMIVPLVLVIAQLQFHYGYGGLHAGEPVLVTARLRDGTNSTADASPAVSTVSAARREPPADLLAAAGVQIQTRAVYIPATKEVIWRIAPAAPGAHDLQLRIGGEIYSKTLHVSDEVVRRSPVRLERGFVNQLLYPAEPPLPDSAPVISIGVAYPERGVGVFGWDVHWMIVYFLLSMVFAFALRKRFDVVL
ncbi:MAG TPA: hypothetical protein VLD67_07110 [Vicinamibacterales bacterium]|nr:hypothetical protein [Vicinamibacterales bacterium]